MVDTDVVIVGAGVAGLACAATLQAARRDVLVLEAADAVGGRVRTDLCQDFSLDRGFQVLLTAYPTCRRLLDLEALHLGTFQPGARVQLADSDCTITDPFRHPAGILATLMAPVGNIADKLRIARLRHYLTSRPLHAVWSLPNVSTLTFLREWGFSEHIIASFFRPFLAGIFLEPELRTSARMFAFVYSCFSRGHAALPAGGMAAIPIQLESRLPEGSVRLNSRVERVEPGRVTLADGSAVRARTVVVATDGDQVRSWFPRMKARPWTGGTTYYFDAPEPPFRGDRFLWLNASGRGRVTHIAVPSRVAAGYAPPGRHLISATTLDASHPDHGDPAQADAAAIVSELRDWFGSTTSQWRFLRTYRLARSLPRLFPEDIESLETSAQPMEGVHLCGDFLGAGSLEGAMASGITAARRCLAGACAAPVRY